MWPGPLIGALLLGICAGALSLSDLGDSLEQRFGLWSLFWLRGPRAGAEEVVIVALRSDTGDRISLPRQRSEAKPCADLRVDETPPTHRTLGDVPQRWGRCHFMELLHRLAAAKPRVVAFDVAFRPRDDLPSGEDRAVATAMRAARNVVLAQKSKLRWLPGRVVVEDGPVELSHEISSAAIGVAPTPIPQQQLDRIDQFQAFKDGPWSAPTLSALALQVYARDGYPSLLTRLRRTMPEAADDLPPDAGELIRGGQLEVHMLHLRSVLMRQLADGARLDEHADQLGASQVRSLRALIELYTGENLRYLNFYGPPGTIRTVHIADVISVRDKLAASDPLQLRDKAVFVGYADNREWDQMEKFATVYGDGLTRMSGVELLATAFANLLDHSDLVASSTWTNLALAVVAASGTVLLCYGLGTFSATLILLASAVGYLTASVVILSRTNVWLPVFVPLALCAPAGYLFAMAYKILHYKRDRANLRSILDKFIPPEVRHQLRDNAKRLDIVKETMNAVCVMTDIEGFTTLSTKLSSERMLELLRSYFGAIFKPIADYGGFVVDLKGDSILAVWPDRSSDPAVRIRACQACLELQAAVARFNQSHPSSRMPTRVGVNYGVVTLAPVGSAAYHVGYGAVGDTVNAGARIEELGKEVGAYVLAAASVIEGLDQFLVRDLGEFSLRGRTAATRIFELVEARDSATNAQIELCVRFRKAKEALDSLAVASARYEFEAILQEFPQDGPSKHFLRIIQRRS